MLPFYDPARLMIFSDSGICWTQHTNFMVPEPLAFGTSRATKTAKIYMYELVDPVDEPHS